MNNKLLIISYFIIRVLLNNTKSKSFENIVSGPDLPRSLLPAPGQCGGRDPTSPRPHILATFFAKIHFLKDLFVPVHLCRLQKAIIIVNWEWTRGHTSAKINPHRKMA